MTQQHQQDDETIIKRPSNGKRRKPDDDRRPPVNWRVIYLNDDYTSINFVCETLKQFFDKSAQESSILAQKIHECGNGIAGIYVKEVAETKAATVISLAQECDFPLQLVIDPVE